MFPIWLKGNILGVVYKIWIQYLRQEAWIFEVDPWLLKDN